MKIFFETNKAREHEFLRVDQQLEDKIQELFELKTPFLILELSNKNYLQVTGGQSRYTVEFREYFDDKFKHYVVGNKVINRIWYVINSGVGAICVMKHEVLNEKDVREIFHSFFKNQVINENYNKRNVTKQHLR